MDVQIPPVFYRTSSSFGAKALLTLEAKHYKPLSRAGVPEIISCLWATGYLLSVVRQHTATFANQKGKEQGERTQRERESSGKPDRNETFVIGERRDVFPRESLNIMAKQ